MKITATNYAAHKPDRASLTDAEQAGYDLIDMGGLDLYGQDADITEAIDLYFVELNHKGTAPAAQGKNRRPTLAQRKASGKAPAQRASKPAPKAAPAAPANPFEGLHPFIFFFGSKKVELYASGLYEAKKQAIAHFKVPKSKEYQVHGALAVEDEPSPAAQAVMADNAAEFLRENGPAIAHANKKSRAAAGKAPKRLTLAQRKAAGKKAGPRAKAPFKLTGKTERAEGLQMLCEPDQESDECVVRGLCNGEPLYFYLIGNPKDVDEVYQVWAVAGEDDDRDNPPKVNYNKLATKRASIYGEQVKAFFEKGRRTHDKNLVLVRGRAKYNRDINETKQAAEALRQTRNRNAQRDAERVQRQQAARPAAEDRYYDSDKKKQDAKAWRDTPPAKLVVGERVKVLEPRGYVKMAQQIKHAGRFGTVEGRFCDRSKTDGRYVYRWYYYVLLDGDTTSGIDQALSAGWVYAWTFDQLTPAPASAPAPAPAPEPEKPAAKGKKRRPTLAERKASGKRGPERAEKPYVLEELPPITEERYEAEQKAAAEERKRKRGTRTKTKKEEAAKPAKPAKAKKVKEADPRTPVTHFDNDVLFMKDFLKLEGKAVTLDQVKKLHVKMEKNIAKHFVRQSSKYAADVAELAGLVAKTFEHMKKEQIATIGKLKFDNPVVERVRVHVEQLRIDGSINLLSRYINLQGTVPSEKQVRSLETALQNELEEYPNSHHVIVLQTALAVLKDWKPGHYLRVSQQQLGRITALAGLGGLGCPDTPNKPCGCNKKGAALSGVPATKATAPTAAAELATAPTAADAYPAWAQEYDEQEDEEEEDSIFSAIGLKDKRRAQGETLPLPGPLGKFIGTIERHEYLMALRGEKGAGKSRLQYQILNLFASLGLRGALFSLEIDKNSDVVTRYTEAYIEQRNRSLVRIASDVPDGLATIEAAAQAFDVVAIDSWTKIPGTEPADVDKLRKKYPRCLFIVIFQSTTGGTARGGSMVEYDASAVCQVNLPGIAVMEKNRYATGQADEMSWDVNARKLLGEPAPAPAGRR